MIDTYTGDISAYRRADGSVRLAIVNPGPLRVTQLVLDQGEPEFVSRTEDVVTFRSTEDDGSPQAYSYRIVGVQPGPEGGWILCEPMP